ncbi:uncharacterized protein Tco025E_05046 [Trypanosoma conorhini]|uniref:Uncharacterized protein n=1 Tax=Trypanosoma conorhini TaxID=83891 RepID=A0A422PGB1_9TRYP|nr:uncharacterized protein Tco025E_05046 [Trypanosoma conorhini]RNF16755.1 hypothetical protein Tco025E_05046 [Trypanosoma conorhini]
MHTRIGATDGKRFRAWEAEQTTDGAGPVVRQNKLGRPQFLRAKFGSVRLRGEASAPESPRTQAVSEPRRSFACHALPLSRNLPTWAPGDEGLRDGAGTLCTIRAV